MENTIVKDTDRQSNGAVLHLVLTVFIIFWMNAGIITFSNGIPGFKYIKILLFILWLAIASSRDSTFISKYFKMGFPLMFCIGFLYIEKFLAYEEYAKYVDITINNIMLLLIITALFVFYCNDSYVKERKPILFAWFTDIIICGIITIIELEKIPMLSRFLSTANPSVYSGIDVLPKGVLSFGNAYSFIFCFIPLCLYLRKGYKTNRIMIVATIVFMLFLIIKMQFAISFFLSFMSFVFYWCARKFQKGKGTVPVLLLPIMLLLIYTFSVEIIDFFISLLEENYELTLRLKEIRTFLLGKSLSGTDLNSRFMKYSESFDAIGSNYLMGALFVGNGKIGDHSELLDCLARYGLVPFLCLFFYFKSVYNETKKRLAPSLLGFLKAVFVLFIMLSIVNTSLWCQMMIVLVFIIPLLFLNSPENLVKDIPVKKELHQKRN